MSEALKPCPLCGEELIHRVTHFYDGSNDLHTAYCHCGFSFSADCSNDEFIKLCNRRSPVWTACSDGLPTKCTEYRTTVLDTRCGARFGQNMRFDTHTQRWTDTQQKENAPCYSVIAWQPLPEPYNPNKAQED